MFKQEKLTCPFTGAKFEAIFSNDNTVSMINPITGERYDFKIRGNAITVPLELFCYIETVTYAQAAEILEVSHQRISKIGIDKTLPTYTVNGRKVFKLSDILRYKELRKVGKPTKEQ